MGAFVISKKNNGDFKFVFTSRKGKTIFTSLGFSTKEACEQGIQFVKDNLDVDCFKRMKSGKDKFLFRMIVHKHIIATSRKYTTELRVQKGIDEILKYASQSETLDFSELDFVFQDEEIQNNPETDDFNLEG